MSNTNYVKYDESASYMYGLYKKVQDATYNYSLLLIERLSADGLIHKSRLVDDLIKATAERMAISAADEVMNYVKGKES